MRTKSLFRSTIKEDGLEGLIEEMDEVASEKIRTLFTRHFIGMKKSFDYAWEAFAKVDRKIEGDPGEHLPLILAEMALPDEESLCLMSDAWRDPICVKTRKKYLLQLIEDAWYPSDDLYIFDEHAQWCLALTHHDFMLIAHSITEPPGAVRKKMKKVEYEVFAVHDLETTYD